MKPIHHYAHLHTEIFGVKSTDVCNLLRSMWKIGWIDWWRGRWKSKSSKILNLGGGIWVCNIETTFTVFEMVYLFHEAISKSIKSYWCSTNLWNLQRVLTHFLQLKKFPDIPVSTWEEARESRPHPEEPRFPLLAREKWSFPWVVGKEFPAFPSHLKRRRSPQEWREELQGHATIPRVPQMSKSIPGKPVFPALPRLSSRGSTHTTVARGTAL